MSKFDNATARSRYFRVLLYPDNEQHQKAYEIIQERYKDEFIGIVHTEQDGEKEHIHIVLALKNPRITSSICNVLGFVNPLGDPDDQFVRAITKQQSRYVLRQFRDCCIYLVHKNAPEKEQYQISDLFGNKDLIQQTKVWCDKYDAQEFDMSDCVFAVLTWISQQEGIISAHYFGKWLCGSPYFKCNSNKVVWAALKEHNLKAFKAAHPVPDRFDSVVPDGTVYLPPPSEGVSLNPDDFESFDDLGFVWGS